MRHTGGFLSLAAIAVASHIPHIPTAKDSCGVTYSGFYQDEIENFVGIRYAQNTGGQNRFKPPKPFEYHPGNTVKARDPGPACPQQKASLLPLYLGNVSSISEDCLRLNVKRPNGTTADSKLPVLVYIHGGSFIDASKDDPVNQPGGLILQSVAIDQPIMHVTLNYRLGVFGFAQSQALKKEGSENAGLRDQRLALEWVHKNIAGFGGDPDKITIHGQSSGGLAMGMQSVAFGASKPAPFQQIIAQSQVLEGGITGNFTRKVMQGVATASGCNDTNLDSAETVQCLRDLSLHDLLESELTVAAAGPENNVGDQWLPVVDGDFLPAPPSELLNTGRFYNLTTMIGWCDGDANIIVDPPLEEDDSVGDYFRQYLPGYSEANIQKLLSLYPANEFHSSHFPNGTVQLTGTQYRAARILRDIALTCQPFFFGEAQMKAGNDVYYYDFNQTFLTPLLEFFGLYGYGVVHTSDMAYIFGNLSHFDLDLPEGTDLPAGKVPYHPTADDFALRDRASRSWASYVNTGNPSAQGKGTLKGWKTGNNTDENYGVYVIGGPNEGYSGAKGSESSRHALSLQKLQERCSFLNSPERVKQDGY